MLVGTWLEELSKGEVYGCTFAVNLEIEICSHWMFQHWCVRRHQRSALAGWDMLPYASMGRCWSSWKFQCLQPVVLQSLAATSGRGEFEQLVIRRDSGISLVQRDLLSSCSSVWLAIQDRAITKGHSVSTLHFV